MKRTHRVAVERLDIGHVTDRKVPRDVALAVHELVRDADMRGAPRPTKARWALEVLADLMADCRGRYVELCRRGELEGWTEDLLDKCHAAEADEAMLGDAYAYLEDVERALELARTERAEA